MVWTWLALLPFLSLLKTKTDSDTDVDEDDTDPDDDEDDEATRNPAARIRSLLQANERLSRKNKKLEERVARLEEQGGDGSEDDWDDDTDEDDPRLLKLENAFLRAAMDRDEPITDLETAWTLATTKGFLDAVKDDGEGMAEALDKLVDRYPYLADVPDDEPKPRTGIGNTGRTPRRPSPQAAIAAGNQALAKRFPALRTKIRRRQG